MTTELTFVVWWIAMTVAGHRHERVAEEIRHELGIMVAGELKDPRIAGLVTITEVRVTPDLKHARVYVSVMGSAAEQKSTVAGLQAAAGFIRHELTERIQLRRAPEVLECHMVAGGFDYLIKARVKDMAAYRAFLGETLVAMPGVRETRTYAVLEEVKNTLRDAGFTNIRIMSESFLCARSTKTAIRL